MTESLGTDYLKPFIESTIAASTRFRRVLIVMITASILAFGAFWNSLDETWFNTRIAAARKGEALLTLERINERLKVIEKELAHIQERDGQKLDDQARQQLEDKRRGLIIEKDGSLSNVRKILENRFKRNVSITSAQELENELKNGRYVGVMKWVEQRMMPSDEQAAYYALKLEEARTANVLLIHIPFFGVVFDVNSLGLWGGSTFSVILLIFRFSLWREYNNLRLAFREAKPEHQRFCYMALAMEQVLTVPPPLSRSRPHLIPRGGVVQGLYFPPLIIQLAVVLNDIRTHDVGDIFNSKLTLISTGASLFFCALIVFLTVRCLQLSKAIDKEWEAAADRVQLSLLEKWQIEH